MVNTMLTDMLFIVIYIFNIVICYLSYHDMILRAVIDIKSRDHI